MLVLFKAEAGDLGKAGGDRDTSSGLAPCMRGWIITRVCQRRIGTWQVLASESVLVVPTGMRGWLVARMGQRRTGA